MNDMEKGKEKCEILKTIRAYVAEKYGLAYAATECNHQGDCPGTCPKCDAELADLQRQLVEHGITEITQPNFNTDFPVSWCTSCSYVLAIFAWVLQISFL